MLRLIQLFPQQPKMLTKPVLLTKDAGSSFSVENMDGCLIYQEGVAHNPSIYVEKIVFVIASLSVMTDPSAAQIQGSTTTVLRGSRKQSATILTTSILEGETREGDQVQDPFIHQSIYYVPDILKYQKKKKYE